ncbi:MAG TPA: hypothetical protein VGP72_01170 [Planctomycetota bacterium]|jgi:hypothetical protein
MRLIRVPGFTFATFGRALLMAALLLASGSALAAMAGGQGIISTVAGTPGRPGFAGDGGPGVNALLDFSEGLSAGPNGDIYIADANNNCIRKLSNGIITTVAGVGGRVAGGYGGDGGPATSALLNFPTSISVDFAGNLYIADTLNCRIRKVDPSGVITTIAGNGGLASTGDGGLASAAGVGTVVTVCLNFTADILYFMATDYIVVGGGTYAVIRQIDLKTGLIDKLAGGTQGFRDGPADQAEFSFQLGGNYIGLDPAGNVFVADETNSVIRAINISTMMVSTIAGVPTQLGFTGDGGPANVATLGEPTGLAMDGDGNLWMLDEQATTLAGRIRLIDLATANINTICGTAKAGFSGDGGPAIAAQVDFSNSGPGICIDISGNLYFSDINNSVIRKIAGAAAPTPVPGTPFTVNGSLSGTGGVGIFQRTPPCPGRFLINAPQASTAQPNQGAIPIPIFKQDQGGGTGPVLITFDPSPSYLPVSSDPNQVFLYQATWEFGDGTQLLLVPGAPDADPTKALATVSKVFCGDQIYKVSLRLDVTILDKATGTRQSGPSAFNTGQVHISAPNLPPTPVIQQLSSPPSGELPYQLAISVSQSFDEDGFVTWAAIDWGDGNKELISPLPPNIPQTTLFHTYSAQGIYQVTLSVIDNGRLPVGTILAPVPGPSDPDAALKAVTAVQTATAPPNSAGNLDRFNPLLRQDSIVIRVASGMTARKGTFQLNFRDTHADKLDVVLQSNVFPDIVANAKVQLIIGNGPTPIAIPGSKPNDYFVTDIKGRFKDSATGLTFDFNAKKHLLHLRLDHAALTAALNLTPTTVVNGSVDLPIKIVFNKETEVITHVRFAYNATAGQKGLGSKGMSFP